MNIPEQLCTICGLCCDGSLLAEVELAGKRERDRVELLGLETEDADDLSAGVMPLPCGALSHRKCTVYSHRPECCRTFECRLLKDVVSGRCELPDAKTLVREIVGKVEDVRSWLRELAVEELELTLIERFQEGCLKVEESGASQESKRRMEEVGAIMEELSDIFEKRFLAE
jgi:Fe-S-cluster containining protein